MASSCCTRHPVDSAYEHKGKTVKVGGIDVYSVGPTDSKLAVILVPDIFGNHPNTLLTVDKLSEALGARVVMPDYFDGKPFPMEKFPLKDFSELLSYLEEHASWSKTSDYTLKVREGLLSDGHKSIGTVGLCWGAKVCQNVANNELFTAGHVVIHPSFYKTEDARSFKTPVLLQPSKEEADLLPFMELLKEVNPEVYKKSGHIRFDDMHHGFCGARAQWTEELNAKRATEAIANAKKFFESNI